MKPFAYVSAQSPESAPEMVRDKGAWLAGGIDLLGLLKESLIEKTTLVNVKGLPGTNAITPGQAAWTIGANTTIATIAAHPGIRKTFPGLAEAAAEVASPQIRNVSTLAGNLAQHSRCWYYRHRDVKCLKNGGPTCYARTGENKYHSLFSGNPCISPVVSNLATALSAFDATVVLWRRNKEISLTMAELYENAWTNPLAHHSLRDDDLILRVSIPTDRTHSAYLQASERSDFDWALVSCAAAARLDSGRLSDCRVVLGAVAPVPYENEEVNSFLNDRILDQATATEAADLLLAPAEPLEHNGYKIPLAKALVRRTLLQLNH
ncbi:MAG: FAD binding domain-containing protein [Opitutaceae bacterium]